MRRPRTAPLVISSCGALCALAFALLTRVGESRAADVGPAPLARVDAPGGNERPLGVQGVAAERRAASSLAERRALPSHDARLPLELHSDRSQLDFVITAGGTPAGGAEIVLHPPKGLELPLLVTDVGPPAADAGVITDGDGRASVVVAPKVKWRGIVRWTPPAPAPPLTAEFEAVSPIAGYPRAVAVDLGSTQSSRYLHIEVRSAPSGVLLCGAELSCRTDDGSPTTSELGPTNVVSGADGRALLWWPMGASLRVDDAGHTLRVMRAVRLDRIPAGVVHPTLAAAAAAAPAILELPALGALHGRLDPSWAAGGQVCVSGPAIERLDARPRRDDSARGAAARQRTAAVGATGHWRIDGLPTILRSDRSRAFATDDTAELTIRYLGAERDAAPRVVSATVAVDVELAAGEDSVLPDPFGPCASVALTVRGPEDVELDGAEVELRLIPASESEDASLAEAGLARRSWARQLGVTLGGELVAIGRVTDTGGVLAPDLPMGRYELRVSPALAVIERDAELEPVVIVQDDLGSEPDRSVPRCRAWGRFEHDGRPVVLQLTPGQPGGEFRGAELPFEDVTVGGDH